MPSMKRATPQGASCLLEHLEHVLLGRPVRDRRAHVRDEMLGWRAECHQHADIDELLRAPVEAALLQERPLQQGLVDLKELGVALGERPMQIEHVAALSLHLRRQRCLIARPGGHRLEAVDVGTAIGSGRDALAAHLRARHLRGVDLGQRNRLALIRQRPRDGAPVGRGDH